MSVNAIYFVSKDPILVVDIMMSNIAIVAIALALLYFLSRKASFIKGFDRPRGNLIIIAEIVSVSLIHALVVVVLSSAFSFNVFNVPSPWTFQFIPALIVGFFVLLLSASIRYQASKKSEV